MTELVAQLSGWLLAHPHLAGLVVGAIACAESLAFVGLVVPGAALMFAAGALIAGGALEFWPTFAWAYAGAVVGDGTSFWVGYRYRGRIRGLWPFRSHPELLARGEDFFRRHGGKSILLGRFVGPVRPVVPIVAGMLGMPPGRFVLTNLASALGWAPAYLLPGMAFGASLVLAGEVAGRLALLLASLVVLVWLTVWGMRWLYRWLQPHAALWASSLMEWSQVHRGWAWLIGDVVDPGRPASRGLVAWFALLVAGAWIFLGVLQDVVSRDPLVLAGQSLYHLLQQLRTPTGDHIMVVFSAFGDGVVTMTVMSAAIAWLLWRRAWRDALYVCAAAGFGALAVAVIKVSLRVPRPVELYAGVDSFSFPSGHATMSVVVYGFITTLVAPTLPARWRWTAYALAAVLIAGIASSRLYLGAHWLADVAGGLTLGLAWIAALAIARQRHRHLQLRGHGLAWLALVTLLVAGFAHARASLGFDLERYAVRRPVEQLAVERWWNDAWRNLPAYRVDLEGRHKQPLAIQWMGRLADIRRQLYRSGWREPLPVNLRTALYWLSPELPLERLPVLPNLQRGLYESLILTKPTVQAPGDTGPEEQVTLRLWRTPLRLGPAAVPVWIGDVSVQRIQHLPLVRFPRSIGAYGRALTTLRSSLSQAAYQTAVRKRRARSGEIRWSGEVLLIRPAAAVAPHPTATRPAT
jgi:membrane protein DedA with SNARE-associated domain/membrane-associated phospholipid phosphatase